MPSRGSGGTARRTPPHSWPSGRASEAGTAVVEALRPEDLARSGRHPTVGRLSIADLLAEWVHHDRNHQRQILANVQAYVWPHMGNAQRFSRPEP